MIRVLYGCTSPTGGGTLNYMVDLVEGHDRAQFECSVCLEANLTGADAALARLERAAVPVLRGPMGTIFPALAEAKAWRARVAALGRFDVANLHQNVPGLGVEWVRAARSARIPWIVRTEQLPRFPPLDGLRWWRRRRLGMRWLDLRTDRAIAVSEAGRDALAARGFPRSRVLVAPTAYREASFASLPSRAAARRALGLPADGPGAGFVAALNEQKRPGAFLDAVESLLARAPDAWFVVAGDGPQAADTRARAARLGPRVRFVGHCADVPTLLAALDVFVLPSLWEGLPITVLEAMRAGCCVVATSVDGTPEAVRDGETGRLVPPGDAAALTAALGDVLADAASRERLAAAGRAFVTGRFDSDALVRRTEEFYESLAASSR